MFNFKKTVTWLVSVAIPGAGAYFSPEGISEVLWGLTGVTGLLGIFGLKEDNDLENLGYIHGVRSSKWGKTKIGKIWEYVEAFLIEPVIDGAISYLGGWLDGANKDDENGS